MYPLKIVESVIIEMGSTSQTHIVLKYIIPLDMQDILRFHAVYWPAMLMSAGLPVPAAVYGHGFLTKVKEQLHCKYSIQKFAAHDIVVRVGFCWLNWSTEV